MWTGRRGSDIRSRVTLWPAEIRIVKSVYFLHKSFKKRHFKEGFGRAKGFQKDTKWSFEPPSPRNGAYSRGHGPCVRGLALSPGRRIQLPLFTRCHASELLRHGSERRR